MAELLFPFLVIAGFVAWLLAALPALRVPEWVARALFLAAAVVWVL